MVTTTEKIPEYMMPYFINGDVEGYSEEEIMSANQWLEKSGIKEVIPPLEEEYQPYFTSHPAFGLACEVVECKCVLEW